MRGVAMGPPPAKREIITTDASLQVWGHLKADWRKGKLENESLLPTYKLLGAENGFANPKTFHEAVNHKRGNPVRQCIGCIQHKSPRWHKIIEAPSSCGYGQMSIYRP